MIRILHFITDTNIGGAGRLLCSQIKHMESKDFEIYVALPKGSMLCSKIRDLPCSALELSHGADRSLDSLSILEALKVIRSIRPDIVHSHGSLSSRIAATLLGIPCRVFTRHCVFPLPSSLTNPISKIILGSTNNVLSTSVIAVAESARQNLVDMGCDNKKIRTIINGVDPLRELSEDEKDICRKAYGITRRNFVISIFARLEEYKGHRTLLEAADICKRYYPNFKFLIVGDGSQKEELIALAKKLQLDSTVIFTGFCDDVAPIFNITHLNVNCSYGTETSSLALSEGMSLGIPAVASDYGGNTHMVKNAVNGLLFPAKNADALAMAIIRMYRDTDLYSKCSAGALRRYEAEFTAQAMSKRMEDFYKTEYAIRKK